jgi:hypothetical protein
MVMGLKGNAVEGCSVEGIRPQGISPGGHVFGEVGQRLPSGDRRGLGSLIPAEGEDFRDTDGHFISPRKGI